MAPCARGEILRRTTAGGAVQPDGLRWQKQFVADSLLEGTGFEPWVPVTRAIFQCRLWLVARQPKVGTRENRHTKRQALPRGTDGSNPVASSGESVPLPELLSRVGNPGFPRGCARWLGRPGRQRRAGWVKIAPTGGNISVAPYSSTAVPLMGSARTPTPVPIKSGRSPSLIVRWISALGPGSTKAQHDPLIVPGKRQA